jgi:hypothetical protein
MAAKTFILADEKLNSYGYRLLMSGARLDRFRANPVALFNHKDYGPDYTGPVGRWANLRIEEGKLMADFEPDTDDDFSKRISGKVDRGFLKGASAGINIISYSEDPSVMLAGQKYPTITEWEPFEASVVDIPSSAAALRLRYNGQDITVTGDADMLKLGLTTTTPTNQPTTTDMNKELRAALGLAETATDAEVNAAVAKLKADKDAAEAKVAAAATAEAESFANETATRLKMDAKQKTALLTLAKSDLTSARALYATAQPTATLKEVVAGATAEVSTPAGDERSKWTIRDWEKKDSTGLLKMKTEQPEQYSALFKATYGG